jgi:hypothetical protein
VAAEGYSRIALRHLEEARQIEFALAPRSAAWYGMEMGREAGDVDLLLRSLDEFSPEEGEPYERTLRALSVLDGRGVRGGGTSNIKSRLYIVNPGGIRQYGLSLPIELNVTGEGSPLISRRLKSLLRRAGYKIVRRGADSETAALMTVSSNDSGKMRWFMSGPNGNTRSTAVSDISRKKRDLAPVLAGILDSFYTTGLGEAEG